LVWVPGRTGDCQRFDLLVPSVSSIRISSGSPSLASGRQGDKPALREPQEALSAAPQGQGENDGSDISWQLSREQSATSRLTTGNPNSARRTRGTHRINLRHSACSAGKKSVRHIWRRVVVEGSAHDGSPFFNDVHKAIEQCIQLPVRYVKTYRA